MLVLTSSGVIAAPLAQPVDATPSDACAKILLFETVDGVHYAAVLGANAVATSTVAWKIYTTKGVYSAFTPSLSISTHVTALLAKYRSAAIAFVRPATEPIVGVAAEVSPPCQTQTMVVSSTKVTHAADELEDLRGIVAELESGPAVVELSKTLEVVPACAEPFRAAQTVNKSEADYPMIAVQSNMQGTSSIRVVLAADGSIRKVEILHSSGFAVLDAAAMDAARRTTYRAERFSCQDRAGEYTFVVDFAGS